jgi:hypothetical protein
LPPGRRSSSWMDVAKYMTTVSSTIRLF